MDDIIQKYIVKLKTSKEETFYFIKQKSLEIAISKDLLPVAGLEPARGCPRQILSLMRLPFRHTGDSL